MTRTREEWPPDRVAELMNRHYRGESARQIAAALGATRNAVIGKLSRLGLSTPKAAVAPPDTRGCQYPHGDPGTEGFGFCGAVPVPGKPYCGDHCRICYRADLSYMQRRMAKELYKWK